MKIYTRAGDKGKTSLISGKKVSKTHVRLKAYGLIDELNCFLGFALTFLKDKSLKKEIFKIQNDLFEIGAKLANSSKDKELDKYLEKRTEKFEESIDNLSGKLPKLSHFILPGGSKAAGSLHVCRTICRKAERATVELSEKEKVDEKTIMYLNRLSDLLFTMARFVNKLEKKKEIIWTKEKR